MAPDNICYLLNNFLRCTAYETVIFCWVMHEQSIIGAVLGRLNPENCDVKCVSLTADGPALGRRIAWDIAKGLRARTRRNGAWRACRFTKTSPQSRWIRRANRRRRSAGKSRGFRPYLKNGKTPVFWTYPPFSTFLFSKTVIE